MIKLKELRIKNNVSQIELANILNVARNTISQWETQRNEISNEMLIKISNYFNVTTDELLGKEKQSFNQPLNNIVSDKEQQLLEYYRKCDNNSQNIILGYVMAKAEKTENLSKFANGKKW